MVSVKSAVGNVVFFIFARYPFVNAITLLLLLAERASRETQPPYHAKAIYVNVGLLFVCAFAMGFSRLRRVGAIVHAIHLLLLSLIVYFSTKLQYRQAVQMRMANRMVGVAGCFFLYAYFSSEKPRPRLLRRTGEVLIGVFTLISTYMVLQVAEDREAFLKMVPGSQPALFICATLLGSIGLCYLPGYFVYDVAHLLVILLTVTTLVVDLRLSYWTGRRGLDYWNQVRLVSDNIAIIAGTVLYLTQSRRKLPIPVDERNGEKVD